MVLALAGLSTMTSFLPSAEDAPVRARDEVFRRVPAVFFVVRFLVLVFRAMKVCVSHAFVPPESDRDGASSAGHPPSDRSTAVTGGTGSSTRHQEGRRPRIQRSARGRCQDR